MQESLYSKWSSKKSSVLKADNIYRVTDIRRGEKEILEWQIFSFSWLLSSSALDTQALLLLSSVKDRLILKICQKILGKLTNLSYVPLIIFLNGSTWFSSAKGCWVTLTRFLLEIGIYGLASNFGNEYREKLIAVFSHGCTSDGFDQV